MICLKCRAAANKQEINWISDVDVEPLYKKKEVNFTWPLVNMWSTVSELISIPMRAQQSLTNPGPGIQTQP